MAHGEAGRTVIRNAEPGISDSVCRPENIRPCPVCGGVERTVMHRQRFLDGGPLGDGYEVVVCRSCGAGFADGIPSQAGLDAYYAEQSKYTYDQADGAESPFDFARFEKIADQVVPFLTSREARILDVGCATGGLLAVLRQRGYGNLLGADPSPACAAAARRLHGVDVRGATLRQLADWTDRFELILLVGVLEHLREVAPAVETVTRLLTPGGLLYCALPDVTAFAECVNAPYQQFSVEHVNFFSPASLNRLLRQCGLAPRRTWRWLVEWREGVTDSVVSGIYFRAEDAQGAKGEAPRAEDLRSGRKKQRADKRPQTTDHGPKTSGPEAGGQKSEVGGRTTAGRLQSADGPLLPFDAETGPALEQYLAKCRAEDGAVLSVIDKLVRSQEPIVIWGAGTLTRRLLATTVLGQAAIAGFVDSNTALQGRSLAGRAILAPAALAGRSETIVIASRAFAKEITETIRGKLGMKNPMIAL